MSAAAVDTLRIARPLEVAGAGRGRAEAHAEALHAVADARREDLATEVGIAMPGAKIERPGGHLDGLEERSGGVAGRLDGGGRAPRRVGRAD